MATLTSDNHLTTKVNGMTEKYFRIPNFEFAQFGSGFRCLLFFPGLQRKHETRWITFLTAEQQALFYDKAVYPSLQAILPPDFLHHFPSSYSLLSQICTSGRRSFSFKSFPLPIQYLDSLIDEIRTITSKRCPLDAFKDFFILTYAKNLKLSTKEVSRPLTTVKDVFDRLTDLNPDSLVPTKTYVDIGCEW
jgi:hypothetical protein